MSNSNTNAKRDVSESGQSFFSDTPMHTRGQTSDPIVTRLANSSHLRLISASMGMKICKD